MAAGGKRKGAGRKPKDEELKAKRLTINALINKFGSEEAAFEFAAGKILEDDKSSFNYFKLLIEYAYGKPKENVDITTDGESLNFKELIGFGSTKREV